MEKLLAFVEELRQANVSFTLDVARPDAVMVTVVVPGGRVEVEFFNDGRVEIERSVSGGDVDGASPDLG